MPLFVFVLTLFINMGSLSFYLVAQISLIDDAKVRQILIRSKHLRALCAETARILDLGQRIEVLLIFYHFRIKHGRFLPISK